MKQHSELLQQVLKTPNISREHSLVLALKDCAMTVIQMEIRPQLRHAQFLHHRDVFALVVRQNACATCHDQQWVELDVEDVQEDDK